MDGVLLVLSERLEIWEFILEFATLLGRRKSLLYLFSK